MFRPLAMALCLAAPPVLAEDVGKVGVDWVGNDIIIEALADPDIPGVTCHFAYFERSVIDRLSQGNWFEDPSNASIACRQTGPIDPDALSEIDSGEDGEEIFSQRRSVILKTIRIKRIYDEANQTLVYLAHAAELSEGSAKMSISTVPLYQPGG